MIQFISSRNIPIHYEVGIGALKLRKKLIVQRMFFMGLEASDQGSPYGGLFNPSRHPSISNRAKPPTRLARVLPGPLDHDTALDRKHRICLPVSLI